MKITDHTTAIAYRAAKGKHRAQDVASGRSQADASMRQMESTHENIVNAALRILSDEAGHYLNDMCTKYADFRGLKEQYKLSHQQVRAILVASPDIFVTSDKIGVLCVLQSVVDSRRASLPQRMATPALHARASSVLPRAGSQPSTPSSSKTPWGPQVPARQAELASPKLPLEGPSQPPPSSPRTRPLQEDDDLFGGSEQSDEHDDELPPPLTRHSSQPTIGKTSLPVPIVPPAVRKQPTLPAQLAPDSYVEQEAQMENRRPAFSESDDENGEARRPLFRDSPVDLAGTNGHLNGMAEPSNNANTDFGMEVALDNRGDSDVMAADHVFDPDATAMDETLHHMEIDDIDDARPDRGSYGHARRLSHGTGGSKWARRRQDFLDLEDSGDEVAGMLTATSSSKVRKTQRPAGIALDGYRPRAGGPGPPGVRAKTSRDSSAVDDSDIQEEEDDEKPYIRPSAGPSRPTTQKSQASGQDDDDDDDDDVIVVTSVRAGHAPARVKTKEEKELERDLRRKQKEIEAERRARKRTRPLPTFRHQEAEEEVELRAAYDARRAASGDLPVESEPCAWELVESFEAPKGRSRRPDLNTIKFWPLNLHFPGRREGEAIVAVAGGCNVRCFRLSEKRGIAEIWSAVDESANWEKEEDREEFFAMAWTYELRKERGISPAWQKWPLLLLAGKGREIKVLDGWSGTVLKTIQGHGAAIASLAVHPRLPHVVASASFDESISLWDISAPVAMPEVLGLTQNALEEDKRRQGYIAGERICLFAGIGGHIEAVLSISFHPTLPLLMSGGVDCKLRIWRLPNELPERPSDALTNPTEIDAPRLSQRPPCYAFPVFIQKELHSHHIDHVSWIGSEGHILTRSWCFDSPGKRVFRLFRPTFFDEIAKDAAAAPDNIGFHIEYASDVKLLQRWTMAGSSENFGDGNIAVDLELSVDADRRLSTQRSLYMPTVEPAVHKYTLEPGKRQKHLSAQHKEYSIRLGEEIIADSDKRRTAPLRAVAVQTAGRGWMVGIGELEKLMFWKLAEPLDLLEVKAALQRQLDGEDEEESEAEEGQSQDVMTSSHVPNGMVAQADRDSSEPILIDERPAQLDVDPLETPAINGRETSPDLLPD